tara:strand:- start:151 stop:372 length:222 start_codon:yes stop_codon:yes gene_type:complete
MSETKKKTAKKPAKKKATRSAVKRTATHGTFKTADENDYITGRCHFRAGREYVMSYEEAREHVEAGGLVEIKG